MKVISWGWVGDEKILGGYPVLLFYFVLFLNYFLKKDIKVGIGNR
ncbi:hypothetical protein ME7_00780 [Bartonella birtlesii LL-WM9]|uniref:Uncharacterized protein n=1 Tax=Bartonella birtlesii LL-WM9 TaxID=1094552 RepID=J0YPV6_9HYPH|nr:hypothetical protein ME7_00780 [Bartonella birtlesii LL-WM9]